MKTLTTLAMAAAAALALAAATPGTASADCSSVARVTSDIWKEYESVAKVTGCLSPIQGPRKFMACTLKAAGTPLRLADKLLKFWNHKVNNSWATIGPRRLSASTAKGTIVGPTKRTFISHVPEFTDRFRIHLDKTGGKGKLKVTVCRTDYRGRTRQVSEVEATGDRTITVPGMGDGGVVSVVLKGKNLKNFSYTIKSSADPLKQSFGDIDGFADLHLHPTGDLAFGGHFTWGSHGGTLTNCKGTPGHLHGINNEHHGLKNHGPPSGWPTWDDGVHQKAHVSHLREAHKKGMKLAVFSMHDFQPLCELLKIAFLGVRSYDGKKLTCNDMDSVHRQIGAVNKLIAANDSWMELALNPWHARRIINDGKLAVIMAIEVSNLFPAGHGSWQKQLDEVYGKGVRSVIIAHETDNDFAGAAMHLEPFALANWIKNLKNPLKAFKYNFTAFNQKGTDRAMKRNPLGLKPRGYQLVDAMVARNMLIDLEHISEKAANQVLDHLHRKHRYYPAFSSHTRLREKLTDQGRADQKEFLSWTGKVEKIKATGGMIGLRTGDNEMETFTEGRRRIANDCAGSSRSYAQMYLYATDVLGVATGFGSDINAPIKQVGPRIGAGACPHGSASEKRAARALRVPVGLDRSYAHGGVAHFGKLPDLGKDLQILGADTRPLNRAAESFLRMWERTWDQRRGQLTPSQYRSFHNSMRRPY